MINRCGHFYGDNILPYQRLNVYYECAQNCRFVPRCVLCDLEPSQINSLRCSSIGQLFNPDYCVTGAHGAGNNWATGYYTNGSALMDCILEASRKQAEKCDCLQGFQNTHSIGGGTGSGLGSLLINRLRDEYENRIINTFSVIPSEKVSETIVEPYNAVLSLKEMVNSSDYTICFDNESLYDVCQKTLKLERPNLNDLNYLVSNTMAGVTSCLRFPGQLNMDLRKLKTNMCPYPHLKFFIPGYAPLSARNESQQYNKVTVKSLVNELFDPCCQLAAYDATDEKYLTCATIFRGLFSSKEVEESMVEVQRNSKDLFCNWIPDNISSAICDIPPHGTSGSATILANTTAINVTFKRLICQFDAMFDKRAFVHWYSGEGMEEMEFCEAKNVLVTLCDEYSEAGCNDDDDDVSLEDDESSNSSECADTNCNCHHVTSECVEKC